MQLTLIVVMTEDIKENNNIADIDYSDDADNILAHAGSGEDGCKIESRKRRKLIVNRK